MELFRLRQIQKNRKISKKTLDPCLKEAKENKRTVLFLDAAHFVHAPFVGFVWCLTRIIIKSPSERQRFNVLGAINAISLELITVVNTTYINANSICVMLKKIKKQYEGKTITIILDNARYQKCKLVMELATVLNIELLYLPTYSPNLNIIERLWKFVKNDCLYSKYYDNFAKFKQAIILSLKETQTKKKERLKKLVALNFQTFKKAA
ncbi:IS630 family transposase [Candidatus Woesearchaeota archaeon]|nr:IS630 family transposase [Candidatus Woesearchaeota archaeon]